MTWEYHHLKRALDLPHDAHLAAFEGFCERAHAAQDAMEWSWKIRPGDVLANRAFWLGGPGQPAVTARALTWLTDRLAPGPAAIPGWSELVAQHTERALVAYAGPDPVRGRGPSVKIYLTLDPAGAPRYAAALAAAGLPRGWPPGAPGVLLTRTLHAQQAEGARVYVLYDGPDCAAPDTAAFLTPMIGARGLALATAHPRAGIGLKSDGTDMLGLGLRPTRASGPHPAQRASPALVPIVAASRRCPLLRERLDRVSWLTVPLDDASLAFPAHPREMNLYVKLHR